MDKKQFDKVWTQEEDNVILSNPTLTVKQLVGLIPSRTFEGIKKRRQKLRKEDNFFGKDSSAGLVLEEINTEHNLLDGNFMGGPIQEHYYESVPTVLSPETLNNIVQQSIEKFEELRKMEETEESSKKTLIKSVREKQK